MKQLQVVTAFFWIGVAGVVCSFAGAVTTSIHERNETRAVIEAHPIPVPAIPNH